MRSSPPPGWALLGSGDPQNAAIAFERASVRLPSAWTVLPRAIALHAAGRAAELRTLLESLRDPHDDSAVQRRAAGDARGRGAARQATKRARASSSTWTSTGCCAIRTNSPSTSAGEFAERGALLVRLGDHDSLPPLLAIAQTQHATTPIADAAAFLGGMLEVARTGAAPLGLEERLGHGGDSVSVALLQAYAHERRGEVADMQTQLARAARLSSSLTKALLARGLAAGGEWTRPRPCAPPCTRRCCNCICDGRASTRCRHPSSPTRSCCARRRSPGAGQPALDNRPRGAVQPSSNNRQRATSCMPARS